MREKHRLLLVTRELVNLTDDQQQEINQLKGSYANLLNTIVSTECGEQGRISERTKVMTDALIGMFYGQSQWRSAEVSESKLTDTLTNFAVGIITAGKSPDQLPIKPQSSQKS